jgi:hypothetical protein
MTQKNRELSQFGSFLEVDNTNKNIAITTSTTPNIGIGTTNPQSKLDVLGNANISGFVSATSYYLNGTALVDASLELWSVSNGDDIYRLNGNVGIGTTIPAFNLDVSGDINLTGELYQNGVPFVGSKWTDGSSSDIYRLDGNVGIGTSTITEKLTILGNISATTLVATGSPPLSVSSQTLVTNLNADYLRGKLPPSGDLVGNSDNQTLTNKTINLANNTLTGNISQFNTALNDADFVTTTGSETLTNKTLTSPVISVISNSGNQNVPTGNGTLVSTNSVGVVTSGMIADGSISNVDIASNAAIAISKLASSTISGVSLGSNLNNLTAGSFVNYNSGTTYNGSAAITVSVAGTTTNTANTLVARNASGDFTAGTITGSVFNATSQDAFRVNGTTVINGGRNIISVENISATGITTSSSGFRDSAGNIRAIPQNSQSVTYTLQSSDVGKHISITAGNGVQVSSGVFNIGDAISVFNNTATQKTITASGVTLRLAGTALSGTRYLAQYALGTIICVASDVFAVTGAGVT